ncbi:uncharacterized protein N7458_007720, partial [Penicillium daleae]
IESFGLGQCCCLLARRPAYSVSLKRYDSPTLGCNYRHRAALVTGLFRLDQCCRILTGRLTPSISLGLWDTVTGAKRLVLRGYLTSVRDIAFLLNSKVIASAAGNQTFPPWSAASGDNTPRVQYGACYVAIQICYLLTRQPAYSIGIGRLYNPALGYNYRNKGTRVAGEWVTAVAFSLDNQLIVSASSDGTVRLWDITIGVKQRVSRSNLCYFSDIIFLLDGQLIATALDINSDDDKIACLWDGTTGVMRRVLRGYSNWVSAVDFSPDG